MTKTEIAKKLKVSRRCLYNNMSNPKWRLYPKYVALVNKEKERIEKNKQLMQPAEKVVMDLETRTKFK